MLKRSLTSFVNLDESAAYKVTNDDDEVDAINRQMYQKVKEKIREDIQSLEYSILVLDISRHLERIADHATNIAEDVIYLCRGEIIRHRTEDFQFLLNTHIPPPE
jgi:phosphate transport system protein